MSAAPGVLLGILATAVVLAILVWMRRRPQDAAPQRRTPLSHVRSDGQPKRGYETRAEAMDRARVLANRDGAAMNAYRCPTCRLWHVGHER